MASAGAKATRRADALQRLSRTLGHAPVDLHRHARGDTEMALIMTLERVADKVDERIAAMEERIAALEGGTPTGDAKTTSKAKASGKDEPPVTVETVKEEPLKTTETVEVVPAEEAPSKRKGAKDA